MASISKAVVVLLMHVVQLSTFSLFCLSMILWNY